MTEFNREEAFMAREIALKKMEKNDFIGAQKIILKAQKLFPELDNVSQLLTICKVQCAAEARVNREMDWYAILQVEAGADEAIIRKQYLKLAFSLHPDKNSFAGAEAAFKLVAEAHSVLCDREKRSQYDIKRRKGSRRVAKPRQKQSNRNFANKGSEDTFWTACPQCVARYQYYSRFLKNIVHCIYCEMDFVAYRVKEDSTRISSNVPNGSRIPTNMFLNQQSDTSSKQGHPVQPSSVDGGGGIHMKPYGQQFPAGANMFPMQQCVTHSQHGDPVDLSSAGGGTYMKLRMNVAQHDELMKEYSIPGSDGKVNQSKMSRREFQFSTPNQEQTSDPTLIPAGPNIVDIQKSIREDPPAVPDVMKAPASANPSSEADGKANQSEMSRREFQFTTLNQEKTSDPTYDPSGPNIVDTQKSIREDPSAVPDVMKAPASAKPSSAGGKADGGPSINVATANEYTKGNSNTCQEKEAIYLDKNFGTKVASTASTAAVFFYTRRSGRRKQDSHSDGDIGLSSDSNKRQRTNDLPAGVDDIVIDDVQQSDPPHVSSQIDIQEKCKTTDRNDLDGINTETADTIHERKKRKKNKKKTCYSEFVSLPDPDFFDFEELRDVRLFSVGQIWALYDIFDRMPRYYAQITRFDPSNFKVHYRWLTFDAMNDEDDNWVCKKMPVACGNFSLEKSRHTSRQRCTFSHIVAYTKGKRKNSYVIYPNKGEVWALYKGWSAKWSSDGDNHRPYEYDVVEVLSSMSVKDGAIVKPLVKIKGFVSLFAPAKDSSSYIIPSRERLRFSHSIPLYRTKGNEKGGVPGGFLELDNACLPADQDAAFPSVTLDSYMSLGNISTTIVDLTTDTTNNEMELGEEQIAQKENQSEAHACHPMSTDNQKNISSEQGQGTHSQKNDQFEDSDLLDSISKNRHICPDPDFHDFEVGRSIEKIECEQIWALYCDFDTFPKFYGRIHKVEQEPFVVHLTWLEACPELDQEKRWLEQDLAVSCGTFEVRSFETTYSSNDAFSHLVVAKQTGTKIEVLPQVGQIWAIYMNWSPDWAPSRTDVGEFAIGKIVERTEDSIKLTFLTRVGGYRSVFKPDKRKGVMEIPTRERLRFSHQIPSFRLTGERGGRLRGFYELDPAGLERGTLEQSLN